MPECYTPPELCELVNKTSGARAGAIYALILSYYFFCNTFNYIYENTTHDTKKYGR